MRMYNGTGDRTSHQDQVMILVNLKAIKSKVRPQIKYVIYTPYQLSTSVTFLRSLQEQHSIQTSEPIPLDLQNE